MPDAISTKNASHNRAAHFSGDLFEQLLERAAILEWEAGLQQNAAEAEAERLILGDRLDPLENEWLQVEWH